MSKCEAEYGQAGEERVNHRNGYRPRDWDTPPVSGRGISVVATADLLGAGTRTWPLPGAASADWVFTALAGSRFQRVMAAAAENGGRPRCRYIYIDLQGWGNSLSCEFLVNTLR